ncbi:MAG TPA: PAS domain-containing methyl-accepting chemotaxis protein [Rhodocyclaceae bacterium]|nr:PAS domain-containing methyl-accepting chemotaxis protein [Rhodocyclaceae bacterium]
MRNNIPVTQQRRDYPKGKTIVSKTDLNGVITYANDAFIEISGFAHDELIGQPHNIVRHPDVPPAIFSHMWSTLRKERPWRGTVKNRCKNGDHYWVDAYIVPLKEQGKTTGYLSARSEPSEQQIQNAEAAYKAVAKSGKIKKKFNLLKFFSIKRGVLSGIIFILIATLVSAFIGVSGLKKTSTLVYELQRYNDVAAMVAKNNQFAANAQSEILLALQHKPMGDAETKDGWLLSGHLARIREAAAQLESTTTSIADNRNVILSATSQIESIVPKFAAMKTANEAVFGRYLKVSRELLTQGFNPVAQLIEERRISAAGERVIERLGPMTTAFNVESEAVARSLFESSLEFRKAIDDLYDSTLNILIAWSIVTAALVSISGGLFFRETIRPLKKSIGLMQKIAEGNLSERLDVYGFAEPGKVASAVAIMQVRLKVMLDEIQVASEAIHGHVRRLNESIVASVNCTEDEYLQATQINASSQNSGADTERFAECALKAYELAQKIAATPAAASAADFEALMCLTNEVAALSRLNAFVNTETQRMSGKILELVADNRENANDAWAVGQKLDETSRLLEEMLNKFE